ncbi:MAG: hypothetical protein ACQEQL_08350 [Pseudomonadota bacterium]
MKIFALAFMIAFMAFPALAEDTAAKSSNGLKAVQSDHVCMVNDTVFDKPQIPVDVTGKTYYGCCMMCKERLQKDTALRTAIDPVSGNEVDKSTAVIGAEESGRVHYFETEENLQKFDPSETVEKAE